jgi:VanZ family protein
MLFASEIERQCVAMTSNSAFIWRLCGGLALAVIIVSSVLLPVKLEQLRSGHWAIEHFLAYFVAMCVICLGWRRPIVVAGVLIVLAALLEVLQSLEPDHTPNLFAALSSVGGVLAAMPLATFAIRRRDQQASSRRTNGKIPASSISHS